MDQDAQLSLICELPKIDSPDSQLVAQWSDKHSINLVARHETGSSQAPSSYIIRSQQTGSRTIVNYNDLAELTADDIKHAIENVLEPDVRESRNASGSRPTLFHFEGRNVQTALVGILHVRQLSRDHNLHFVISVEVEKPGREGLRDLANAADFVFYSRAWALSEGYDGPLSCISGERNLFHRRSSANLSVKHDIGCSENGSKALFCTWGEDGAAASHSTTQSPNAMDVTQHTETMRAAWSPTTNRSTVQSPASSGAEEVVDSVGAGDTWIAAMIYCIMKGRHDPSPAPKHGKARLRQLNEDIDFANEVAGRKIFQDGFDGLGKAVAHLF